MNAMWVTPAQQVRQNREDTFAARAGNHVTDARDASAVYRLGGTSFKHLAAMRRGIAFANDGACCQLGPLSGVLLYEFITRNGACVHAVRIRTQWMATRPLAEQKRHLKNSGWRYCRRQFDVQRREKAIAVAL
jgi:hypothetical protein